MIAKWHATAIGDIPNVELIGATDTNQKSMEIFASQRGIKAYGNVQELVEDPSIDIVCICTPSGFHASQALEVLAKRKHVIVEKPMAITVDEADQLIQACKDNGVQLGVISQLRFAEGIKKLKEAVEQGILGKIVMGDLAMKFYRSQDYYNTGGWRGTWKMDGGGALMNQGIHGIDLLQYVMGPVASVFAYAKTLARDIEVEDTAAAVLEFKNGALGIIQGTTSIYPGFSRKIEINGTQGTIVLEEDTIIKWEVQGQEGDSKEDLLGQTMNRTGQDPNAFDTEGHRAQILDFIAAIGEQRKPIVDVYEGRKPIEIILAIYESARTGKVVYLE